MTGSNKWDFGRFWQTLDYFEVIPFMDCIQNLFGQKKEDKSIFGNDSLMNKALVISPSNISTIGQKLQDKSYQVQTLSDFSNCNPSLFPHLDLIVYEGDDYLQLVNFLKKLPADSEKILFDFSQPTPEMKEIWGAVDDVVMGGVSESQMRFTHDRGVFTGNVSTANNGGFASVRTRNFTPALNLSDYEGIELRVEGDGKRYKLICRCEGRWDGVGYCYSFDTIYNFPQTIRVPFRELIPVFRAKTLTDGEAFDSSKVYSLQLMHSKFEYDGALNPRFSPGIFGIDVEWIKAYGRKTPRLVIVGSETADRRVLAESGWKYSVVGDVDRFSPL
ncbi:MAG: hypothetical protein N5P05_002958 [Chroococcopsis gigantea SAG 12.99]|jgi:hypothetical protein|nr:CIA30 family protein [Chlorogloea purpurea SAG 13.99]MDV3001352.1 hypothetical protein [Chroococcopsis gigantea SAG 12.99]